MILLLYIKIIWLCPFWCAMSRQFQYIWLLVQCFGCGRAHSPRLNRTPFWPGKQDRVLCHKCFGCWIWTCHVPGASWDQFTTYRFYLSFLSFEVAFIEPLLSSLYKSITTNRSNWYTPLISFRRSLAAWAFRSYLDGQLQSGYQTSTQLYHFLT